MRQFADRYRAEMAPLSPPFSYHAASVNLTEEDIKEYLQEPISALPGSIISVLPKVLVYLVPFLEVPPGKEKQNGSALPVVSLTAPKGDNGRPDGARADKNGDAWVSHALHWLSKDEVALFFAVNEQEVADYHYRFYQLVSMLAADRVLPESLNRFYGLLREELNGQVHGEVDDESWHLKQALMRRQSTVRRDTKPFVAYARRSFVDTLTLYLHGICCDIDVEPGPRQIASRFLRRRLALLQGLFPPPHGYVLFPEELQHA